jgi:cystathionine gamma-synthase/methionine-gamma-lyase
VTYLHDSLEDLDAVLAGSRPGFVYGRYANPTVDSLERAVSRLEGTESALACASGMAALHLALHCAGARRGATILAARDLYGGTRALLSEVFVPAGVTVKFADMTDIEAVRQSVRSVPTAVVLAETISNPLLRVIDVPAVSTISHQAGAQFVLDNTFAVPCLYPPAADGVDWVVYSATKYHGGHGDVMGGLIASSFDRCRAAREANKVLGSILGPSEAWLVLRGIKTLVLRSRQQCASALTVARFLQTHPRIARVFYPGLTTHPQFTLARRLFASNLAGAIVSFELKGAGRDEVFRFMEGLRLITSATSLGDVYSLILYPAQSSHRGLSSTERADLGIGEGLVRLSVGIEEPVDLVQDLAQALGSLEEP